MEINQPERNEIIGELIIKEKYKFLPNGLIGEIVNEAFDKLEEMENKQ